MLIAAERFVICYVHVSREDHEKSHFRFAKLNNTPALKQFDFLTLIRLLKATLLAAASPFLAPLSLLERVTAAAVFFPTYLTFLESFETPAVPIRE